MKEVVDSLLRAAFEKAQLGGELKSPGLPPFVIEVPNDPAHGELASNLALALARGERRAPRDVAEILRRNVPVTSEVAETSIAGPGFLNFRLSRTYWRNRLGTAIAAGKDYGCAAAVTKERVQVEFVSANPTGPLTVGHGRNAVLGDTLARLLAARRARRHARILLQQRRAADAACSANRSARGTSSSLGRPFAFPEDGYQGDYIREIAAGLEAEHGPSLAETGRSTPFQAAAENAIFADIERTLERMRIRFDVHFNEDSLYRDGSIEKTLVELRAKDLAYDKEGAVWLRTTALGMAADRVLVKSTGEPAYRLPDIAYHRNKLERGFDRVVDVFGADHIAVSEEVRAGVRALGLDADRIRPIIYQFVTLVRDGKPVKMSTRRAEYVTLDELLDEVGVDVVRFLFLTRKADSHLEFDLEPREEASRWTIRSTTCSTRTRGSRTFSRRPRRPGSPPAATLPSSDWSRTTRWRSFGGSSSSRTSSRRPPTSSSRIA